MLMPSGNSEGGLQKLDYALFGIMIISPHVKSGGNKGTTNNLTDHSWKSEHIEKYLFKLLLKPSCRLPIDTIHFNFRTKEGNWGEGKRYTHVEEDTNTFSFTKNTVSP